MPAGAGQLAPADGGPPDLDSLRHHARTVVTAVRAVLAGDRAEADAAVATATATAAGAGAACTLATGGLAARLPALSGVTGDVVFDEPEDELLHAYAALLSERAEPLRRRTGAELRDAVVHVAHRAAAAAHERSGGQAWADLARGLVLPDVAPDEQLVAACVLLAQTSRDGGAGVDALAAELHDLAAELAGSEDRGTPG